MVRHLKVPDIQQQHHHHHNAIPSTTTSSSSTSSISPLAIRIPSTNLLHPLIHETSANAAAVTEYIPGLKTSAAFLSSLRANLSLSSGCLDPYTDLRFPPSPNPSLATTPIFGATAMSSSIESLPPTTDNPSNDEIALAADNTEKNENDPLAGIPPLTTYTAETQDDIVEALHLVADSVAQQRQYASRQLIFHPFVVAIWVAILAVVAQFLYKGTTADLLLVGTTWAGLIMGGLLAIRLITGPFLEFAEQTGTWKWLGKDSDIIITKYGNEIIGAVIVLITKSTDSTTSNPPSPTTPTTRSTRNHKKSQSKASAPLRGLIRGWTVQTRYRHKGIGGGLLEEAVRLCKQRGVQSPSNIEFADDHANSGRIFPSGGDGVMGSIWSVLRFNGAMDRKEDKGRAMLNTVAEEIMGSPKTRRRRGS